MREFVRKVKSETANQGEKSKVRRTETGNDAPSHRLMFTGGWGPFTCQQITYVFIQLLPVQVTVSWGMKAGHSVCVYQHIICTGVCTVKHVD